MADLAAIRAGLIDNLAGYFPGYQATGYTLEAPTAPFFDIELGPEGITYDLAFNRGYDTWQIIVRVVVQRGNDIASQVMMDEHLLSSGGTSVKEALESDMTLGGACLALHVRRASGYRPIGAPGTPHAKLLACEWTVEVWTQG